MSMEETTMTEVMMGIRAQERIERAREAMKMVLDFVERHNKQDYEREVAHAAQFLEELLFPSLTL